MTPHNKLIEEKLNGLTKYYSNVRCSHENPMVPLKEVVTAFTDLLTQQREADIAAVKRLLPAEAPDNNYPNDHTKGYAHGVLDSLAALRSHQGETLSE